MLCPQPITHCMAPCTLVKPPSAVLYFDQPMFAMSTNPHRSDRMIKDISKFYSKNARNMMRSEIGDLLKLTRQPGVISFGGGLRRPETFPVAELEEITCELLRKKGAVALQYGPTEGEVS